MLPLSCSGHNSAPWPPTSGTRLPHPSPRSLSRPELRGRSGRANFCRLAPIPIRPLSPRGSAPMMWALTTLLSIALSRCRPTADSVSMQPLSLRAGKSPLAATVLRQVLRMTLDLNQILRSGQTSLSSGSRRVLRARRPSPLASGSTSRFPKSPKPSTPSGWAARRMLRYAYYPC
jgi:hypothetical protein